MPTKTAHRIVLISPNPFSLYTLSVAELLLRDETIKIEAIVLVKFTLNRFLREFKRDGMRLVKKIWKKLFLKSRAYKVSADYDNIITYRRKNNLAAANVIDFAKAKGIKIIKSVTINDEIVEQELKKINPNLIVFTGGGLIKENIISIPKNGITNCHMGVLPLYRGMDVVEWPLLKKDFGNLGFTIHLMAKGVDTGDILSVHHVDTKNCNTIKQLREKFEPLMTDEYVKTIKNYLHNSIQSVPQSIQRGKQYFIMNSELIKIAEKNLAANNQV